MDFRLAVVTLLLFLATPSTRSYADIGGEMRIENDVPFNTDHNYTNGLQALVYYVIDEEKDGTPLLADLLCKHAAACGTPGHDGRHRQVTTVQGVGQLMYTPTNIKDPNPQPNDRPWGGWLYYTYYNHIYNPDTKSRHTIGVDVGTLGPASHAEDVQKWFHDQIGADTPRGWDNQINNEPGVIFRYKYEKITHESQQNRIPGAFALTWHTGTFLGNVFDSAQAGATLKWGVFGRPFEQGPTHAAPVMMPKSLEDKAMATTQAQNDPTCSFFYSCYIFIGAEARAVAWNAFIDGDLPYASNADKKHLIGDAFAGGHLELRKSNDWWSHLYVTATVVRRSSEFESPVGDGDSQTYAVIVVGKALD